MKRLINHIKMGGTKNVLIVGDVMLDEYFFGSVSRISPEAPVPVLKEERKEFCMGGAANVAANCNHIGFDVSLVGVVGEHDQDGKQFIAMLTELKIATDGLVSSDDRVTTIKKRFLSKNHQMFRMDCESTHALCDKDFELVTQKIEAFLKPSSIILVSDYAKGVITDRLLEFLRAIARERECMILVDPKGPDFAKYYGVDYIKPNAKEFAQMVKFFKLPTDQSLENNAREVCRLLALKGLVVTEGERGITFVSQDASIFSPAYKQEVYDLTGAGDTVFAFLALGLSHGLSIEDCLKFANRAASVAVAHLKTYAVSLDELIDRSAETNEKIYADWASLKIELDWQRVGGKKVVFTNGCFDILHPGHIHILKEAKKMGDILVVALNTDDSISRLKGPARPINDINYRATMMAAIGFVDFVVSFDQDTPQALIDYIRPDVLVKGGDYQKEKIIGYDTVMSYGGCVQVIDLVPGQSTTGFIARIKDKKQNSQQGV
jgi:D-beta-D-heptose 7-phosphate kinase/D-beta-D-heptose 1-phosphate adenosyltransferase